MFKYLNKKETNFVWAKVDSQAEFINHKVLYFTVHASGDFVIN